MAGNKEFNTNLEIKGKINLKDVPNNIPTGYLVWNSGIKDIAQRTPAQVISDLGLITATNIAASYYTKTQVDTNIKNAVDNIQVGGRNLVLKSNTDIDILPLYGVTATYVIADDTTNPTKKIFKATNIVRTAGNLVFYIPFYASSEKFSGNLSGIPLTISFYIRTNNSQFLDVVNENITSNWKKVSFQYTWFGSGNLHFSLIGDGLQWFEIHSLKIEKGNKATDWTPAPEDQITDWNTTDVNDFSFLKNKPTKLSQFTNDAGYLTSMPAHSHSEYVTLGTEQTIEGAKIFNAPTTMFNTRLAIKDSNDSERFVFHAGVGRIVYKDVSGFEYNIFALYNNAPSLSFNNPNATICVNAYPDSIPNKNLIIRGGGYVSGEMLCGTFKKTGGTPNQFLKADGSIDSSEYATLSALTPYAQTSWVNANFDKYGSWNLKMNGVQKTTVVSGGTLDLNAGSNVSLSYGAGGVITINAVNTDTNTTYVAGDGISITGSNNVITNTKPNIVQTLSGSGNTVNLSNGGSYTFPAQTFASITGKPTSIAGYGITDAIKINNTDGLNIHSGVGTTYNATSNNSTWFDYNWAGTGLAGSVINFSGLDGRYTTEIFGNYSDASYLGFRTRNGDNNTWNSVRKIWHEDNFTPSDFLTQETDPTVPAHVKSISALNINNWNKSLNADFLSEKFLNDANLITNGTQTNYFAGSNQPSGTTDGSLFSLSFSDKYSNQQFHDWRSNEIFTRSKNGTNWSNWEKLWSSKNFSQTNINNWNAAVSWGDHAGLYSPINHGHTVLNVHSSFTQTVNTPVWNIPIGLTTAFVDGDSGYGSYGSVLNLNTFPDSNGGALQLYVPYADNLGGTGLKYRKFNYGGTWGSIKTLWDSGNLTNLSQLSNDVGYLTSSALSPYAQTSWVNANFDKYTAWNLQTNNVQRTSMPSGSNLNLVAGSNVTINYSAGGTVTIGATSSAQNLSFSQTTQSNQINISGGNSVTIENRFLGSFDGSRNPDDIKPNTSPKSIRADFANAGAVRGTGNYAGVLTYAPWDGKSDSTGDSSYQLAFINETGINGTGNPGLRLRKGIDTTWGSWISILTSVNGVTLDTSQTISGVKTFTGTNMTIGRRVGFKDSSARERFVISAELGRIVYKHIDNSEHTIFAWNAADASPIFQLVKSGSVLAVGCNADTYPGSALMIGGNGTFSGSVIASGFVKSGGSATQILMADGSVKEQSTIGGSNYTAGSNISIAGNIISVVNSPEFSGSVRAPAFYEGSLKSLKKNINTFENSGLELVNELEIVTFDRKDESAKNKIGIIADDSPKEFLSEELDAVDLYKTVFIQAKAIQELTEENRILKEEFNNLRELIMNKL